MKLKTLLKNITLPIYAEREPETDRPRLGSTGYAIHRDSEVIADGIQTPELAEYLCHAANVLPDIVDAAQEVLLNTSPGHYPPPKRSLDKLRATITKAKRINPRT